MEELKTIGLFRCTEKQYADAFCATGNMKFNTPRYWIDLEKESGKGRGDAEEGVYAAVSMYDIQSLLRCSKQRKNISSETKNGITYFRSNDILNLPCYCLFALNNTMFKYEYIDKKGIIRRPYSITKDYFHDFADGVTKETIKELPENQRPALVIINNPKEFFSRIRKYFIGIGVKEEVGKEVLDYVLKADSNILESIYSENAEGVVNRIKIYDEEYQYLGVVQNDELINLVGIFQEVYIKEEDKQAKTVASSMLQGITKEVTVTVKGNTSCLSGKVIKVVDSLTKLVGSFYIESDEHEWSNGQYIGTLNLSLEIV